MDILTRRIGGKAQEFKIYSQEEADATGIEYVYWKQAQPGDWALSDDGYVGECLKAKTYTDGRRPNLARRLVTLSFGRMWVYPSARLEYLPRKAKGAYSYCSPTTWADVEARKTRTKRTVHAYALMVIDGQGVDWKKLGLIYRPDQRIPAATVRRLFKQEAIREMIDKRFRELISARGITEGDVIDMLLGAFKTAEANKDAKEMRMVAEDFRDMFDMNPKELPRGGEIPGHIEGAEFEEIQGDIDRAKQELSALGKASVG